MSKLQKYNRFAFAVISVPVFLLASLALILMIKELIPKSYPEYDQNKGVISKSEAEKNATKEEYTQYISYNNMFMLNSSPDPFRYALFCQNDTIKTAVCQVFSPNRTP